MSSLIARRNLRRFSAARSFSVRVSILESLVTPSTSRATSGPKFFLDFLDGCEGILDRIVKQRRDDRFLIELQLGHQARNFDRMAEIGIAAGALLAAVFLHSIDIGAVEDRLVGVLDHRP
jgi:hypothetical protein